MIVLLVLVVQKFPNKLLLLLDSLVLVSFVAPNNISCNYKDSDLHRYCHKDDSNRLEEKRGRRFDTKTYFVYD